MRDFTCHIGWFRLPTSFLETLPRPLCSLLEIFNSLMLVSGPMAENNSSRLKVNNYVMYVYLYILTSICIMVCNCNVLSKFSFVIIKEFPSCLHIIHVVRWNQTLARINSFGVYICIYSHVLILVGHHQIGLVIIRKLSTYTYRSRVM